MGAAHAAVQADGEAPIRRLGLFELPLEKATEIPAGRVRVAADQFCGYIGGWASLEVGDREGDIIPARALDLRLLLEDGWFNDNHSEDTNAVVGYPVIAEVRRHPDHGEALWAEGPILDTDRGRAFMENVRKLVGTARQFGFSVEGPPPVRDAADKRRILRALVLNIAVTNRPVNRFARITLVKSLSARLRLALRAFEKSHPDDAAELRKTLGAAYPTPNATAQASAALQVESHDGKPTEQAEPKKKKKNKARPRRYGITEAADLLRKAAAARGLPETLPARIIARLRTTGGRP